MRVQGSEFRVQGSGFRVQGSGFRVQGFESKGTHLGLDHIVDVHIALGKVHLARALPGEQRHLKSRVPKKGIFSVVASRQKLFLAWSRPPTKVF